MWGKVTIALLWSAALLPTAGLRASDPGAIPAGTTLDVRLATKLTTKSNHVGDTFSGEIDQPVTSGKGESLQTATAGLSPQAQMRKGQRFNLFLIAALAFCF
jgi:hypothetical protein